MSCIFPVDNENYESGDTTHSGGGGGGNNGAYREKSGAAAAVWLGRSDQTMGWTTREDFFRPVTRANSFEWLFESDVVDAAVSAMGTTCAAEAAPTTHFQDIKRRPHIIKCAAVFRAAAVRIVERDLCCCSPKVKLIDVQILCHSSRIS